MRSADVAIVGAGPIGLELAAALKQAGLRCLHFDSGQIAQTIYDFPTQMRFYSSPQRIALGGLPIHTPDQSRCTREEYLAYLRTFSQMHRLEVETFRRVIDVQRIDGGFRVTSVSLDQRQQVDTARNVVLATGGTSTHRVLGIPGEELPHVSHRLHDPHRYFRRRLLVVGGRNSAVEAALRCYHAGAHVTMSYRGESFPDRVKYWLRPEINMLIDTERIRCHFRTEPVEIRPREVVLSRRAGNGDDGGVLAVPCDDVLLMIGYRADPTLYERAGVKLVGEERRPEFNDRTMETNVPGLFVAGTACAGTQTRFEVFLENCHVHVQRIVAAMTGAETPAEPLRYAAPEE